MKVVQLITCLFIALASVSSSYAAPKSPLKLSGVAYGALFKQATREISLGEHEKAKFDLGRLGRSDELRTWSKIFLIENEIAQDHFSEAQKQFGSLDKSKSTPLQKLYLQKFEIEFSFSDPKLKNTSKLEKEINDLANTKSKILKSEVTYLKNLIRCKKGNYKTCITAYQDIRLLAPKSIASYKAFKASNIIIAEHFVKDRSLFTRNYWLREIRALTDAGNYSAALSALNDAVERSELTDKRDLKVFELKLKLLKAVATKKELSDYLDACSEHSNPLRFSALSEVAVQAWNQNDHKALDATLNKIGRTPFSIYLRARIEEEKSNFQKAISKYEELLKIGGHQYQFPGGIRLAWLYLREDNKKDATRILTRLKKINPNTNYYDTEAINYWLNYSSNQKSSKNASFQSDPRLYYYWIKHGAKITLPNTKVKSDKQLKLTSARECDSSKVTLAPARRSYLEGLTEVGLYNFLREEFSLMIKEGSNEPGQVRARASFIQELGASSEGILELRESESTYARLEERCLGPIMEILYPRQYKEIFQKESKRTGVDPYLLMAITRTESAFDPLAISSSGAMGLMQLMPKTAELEGFDGYKKGTPENAFKPEVNIVLGANHLQRLLNKYGDQWHLVIAAYNAGGEAVDRWLKRYPNTSPEVWVELISYKETRNYVKKVLGSYWAYKLEDDQ